MDQDARVARAAAITRAKTRFEMRRYLLAFLAFAIPWFDFDPRPPRQRNEHRVVLVGGSTSIGWGVAEKRMPTERTGEALEKDARLDGPYVRYR